MKLLAIIALLVLLVAPGMAMTNNQSMYLQGFQDGWNMLYLRFTDVSAYNEAVQAYDDSLNASLNASEAAPYLRPLVGDYMPELPEVFR